MVVEIGFSTIIALLFDELGISRCEFYNVKRIKRIACGTSYSSTDTRDRLDECQDVGLYFSVVLIVSLIGNDVKGRINRLTGSLCAL